MDTLDSRIRRRSVVIDGHKTSVSIEDEFWFQLKEMAQQRCMTLAALISEIDVSRKGSNFSSQLRLSVLRHLVGRPS